MSQGGWERRKQWDEREKRPRAVEAHAAPGIPRPSGSKPPETGMKNGAFVQSP